MASGDTLVVFHPYNNEPPSSNYATLDTRNQRPCLDFDASTDESAVFSGIMPQHYAGTTGVTVILKWAASTDNNNAHACYWDAAFEDWSALDLDGDDFAAVNSANGNPSATLGIITSTSITFTDGADMDNVAAGDPFRLKVTRDADNGSDDMTGDAEIYAVEIRET